MWRHFVYDLQRALFPPHPVYYHRLRLMCKNKNQNTIISSCKILNHRCQQFLFCDVWCYRADSGFAPSQWETSLQSNAGSHWLGTSLESTLMLDQSTANPACLHLPSLSPYELIARYINGRISWKSHSTGWLSQCDRHGFLLTLDSFTVPLHSPNGRHLPAIRAVQGDCQWPVKNGGNFHPSYISPESILIVAVPTYIYTSQS